jgi:hypothetical protein
MFTPSKRSVVVKWLILAVLFTCLPTSWLFAQNFSLGLKAGPLVLWSPYGDKDDGKDVEVKPKFGFYAAGIINFPLKNNYTCVIEGGFSQKGRSVEFEGNFNNGTYYFIDAALLLRKSFNFRLGKNVPATGFFNIGPHISYWLGGKGTVGGIGGDGSPYKIQFIDSLTSADSDFKTMYMVDVNRWLFGADIGFGMTAPIKKTQRVLVELRFTWGHTFYGSRTAQYYNWVQFTDNNLRANEKVLSLTGAYIFDFDLKESKKGRSTKDKEIKRKPVKRRKH